MLQVVHGEGAYANGSAAIQPLPEEIFGTGQNALVRVPLRRLGHILSLAEVEEHETREFAKVCVTWCYRPASAK